MGIKCVFSEAPYTPGRGCRDTHLHNPDDAFFVSLLPPILRPCGALDALILDA